MFLSIEGLPQQGCDIGVLTAWSNLSDCSTTCGKGERFRIRTCVKYNETDKDCEDDFIKAEECFIENCTGNQN